MSQIFCSLKVHKISYPGECLGLEGRVFILYTFPAVLDSLFEEFHQRIESLLKDKYPDYKDRVTCYKPSYIADSNSLSVFENNLKTYKKGTADIIYTPSSSLFVDNPGVLSSIRISIPLYYSRQNADPVIEAFTFYYDCHPEIAKSECAQLAEFAKATKLRMESEQERIHALAIQDAFEEARFMITAIEIKNTNKSLHTPFINEQQEKNIIPGTTKRYFIHRANTFTLTQKHIHVYVDGKQVYSLNIDGSSHDGSYAYKLSKKEIAFLKSLDFTIPKNGIVESLDNQDDKPVIS